MAEYRHHGQGDPQWVDFPNNLPPRTRICGMKRARDPIQPQEGLYIGEFDVPVRDGHLTRLRAYRRTSSCKEAVPLFVNIRGGGYVNGGLETDDGINRAIALKINIVIVSIEYRLAPENKFPTGFGDCFDIVRWIVSEEGRKKLNVDLARGFILGGTSAGANFTAGISHLAVLEGLTPKITGVVLLAGSFCHPDARPAKYRQRILRVDEINDAPGLTRKSVNHFAAQYGAPPEDKRLSPLLFESHADIAKRRILQSVAGIPAAMKLFF